MAKTLPWHVVKAVWTNFVLNYMASAFMVLELKGMLTQLPHHNICEPSLQQPLTLGALTCAWCNS